MSLTTVIEAQNDVKEIKDHINEIIKHENKKIKIYLNKINLKVLKEDILSIIQNYNDIEPIENYKMNLILDLDQTLIFSKENIKNEKADESKNIYNFSINQSNQDIINFHFQFRQGLVSFMNQMKQFCNLYINTLSNYQYALSIIKIINEKADCDIKVDNIKAKHNLSNNNLKYYPSLLSSNNLLIIDDTLRSWETDYFDYIIPSMKFQGFTNLLTKDNIYSKIYQYYFSTKKIYVYDEYKRNCYDVSNNLLFCMETENSDFSQFYHLSILLKKI